MTRSVLSTARALEALSRPALDGVLTLERKCPYSEPARLRRPRGAWLRVHPLDNHESDARARKSKRFRLAPMRIRADVCRCHDDTNKWIGVGH